ncbi:DUF4365 domain-containing protein [Flagellimonas zhangzhouensis]|uniref:DUF4365 domain-containing protein n=1 Tax=Flagellimonas zhangzhouensis TaxID=1073328 RepID=A0A1H2RAV6_9FLAO|nr:DUF4365 domain-containing protein [Allomuricauda zhangzhouensis]SDQ61037.1 protein of unknown function [Allomuricauda zhangzhouensis]SDW15984.1 protein of unknown function [Allomuricauda zhangzhouensis]
MPTRPNQHDLEDISRAKFRLCLPRKWVVRDKSNDYGIDLEVEIFDNDGNSTGIFFWVQLKATDSNKPKRILNVSFSLDTLNYYKTLDVPVLLARYSANLDSFYIKWISNIDLFFAKKNAESFRIKLNEDNLWSTDTSSSIENYLFKVRAFKYGNFAFPIPISIHVNQEDVKGELSSIFHNKLKKTLNKFKEFVLVTKSENALFSVTFEKNSLIIAPPEFSGCWFHNLDKRKDEEFIEGLSADVLIGIAICLLNANKNDIGASIIFKAGLSERLVMRQEIFTSVFQGLLNSSYQDETIEIAGKLLDNQSMEATAVTQLNIAFLANNNKSKIKSYEKFLKQRLDKAVNDNKNVSIGICHYNLGNYYSHIHEFTFAVKHYNLCRKYAPIYLNHEYYFSELASVLFRSEKYSISATLYKCSLDIKDNSKVKGLFGDALMFSGRYKQAISTFEEYLKQAENPIDEFFLKLICLKALCTKFEIEKQTRKEKDALKYYESVFENINVDDDSFDIFLKVLDLDFLYHSAWYNMGELLIRKNLNENATICFLMSALINHGDIEAWINSTIGSMSSEEYIKLLPSIIRTAFFFNKEDYLVELYSHLESSGQKEMIFDLSKFIDTILSVNSEKKERPTMRILNGQNRFTEIDDLIRKLKDK